ncbi:unnamed protein product [Linum trigynum]|uniref:Glyoxysomal processing protease, glyoxysomal n=1 Tax=Linum trigynum TaxID=586398 RepID=A0AAV2FKL5_9ROSI
MNLPEIVDSGGRLAAMVRVSGPDPHGRKLRNQAFHHYSSGITTLSASAVLLPEAFFDADAASRILPGADRRGGALLLTVASVIEAFVAAHHRQTTSQGLPDLIPEAKIDVMLEFMLELEERVDAVEDGDSRWICAELLRLVDVPASSMALQSLIEASSGSPHHGWETGWSLASQDSGPKPYGKSPNSSMLESHSETKEYRSPTNMSRSITRLAVLGIPLLKNLPRVPVAALTKRGDFLLAMGSPFGIMSPLHFFNSISVGSIANYYHPPRSPKTSLLMADIRCLPGTEGGPAFDKYGRFIGILISPLRQKSTGAEIQLVIPWEAIASACIDLLLKEPENAAADKEVHINKGNLNAVGVVHNHDSAVPSLVPVEKAMPSICLVTMGEGVWASGVLLNEQGLVLTNAHLLEPWRFGRTTVSGGGNEIGSEIIPCHLSREDVYQKNNRGFLNTQEALVDPSRGSNFSFKEHQTIRVRLDHVDPLIWCSAKVVYISRGPLDVALLQLENVPAHISPISVDLSCPALGSKAYVIGHALFGPKCGFSPSVCSGVVAKIVRSKATSYDRSHGKDSQIPAMLETTAAVHPGGSGGAVVNSEGQMIGLVTSNTRHGRGTVIPHLNFSIPCAALAPIFEFSKDMQDIMLLKQLDQPNDDLSSVWSLLPPISPMPKPELLPSLPLPLNNIQDSLKKSGKGSKFAKFLAERDEVLRRPVAATQLGKVGSSSSTNESIHLPSKL